jgi:hypothetical protein
MVGIASETLFERFGVFFCFWEEFWKSFAEPLPNFPSGVIFLYMYKTTTESNRKTITFRSEKILENDVSYLFGNNSLLLLEVLNKCRLHVWRYNSAITEDVKRNLSENTITNMVNQATNFYTNEFTNLLELYKDDSDCVDLINWVCMFSE